MLPAQPAWRLTASAASSWPIMRRSAAPIGQEEIESLFADRIGSGTDVAFDPATGTVRASHGRRLGAILLSGGQDSRAEPAAIEAALLEGVRSHGVALLAWSDAARSLRKRAAFARTLDEAIPDLSDDALLARLDEKAEELSLCFDPDSGMVGEGEGTPLFDGDKPTESLTAILKFCEDFEIAAQRTSAFVKELADMDLLIDGEVTIQPDGAAQPFVYRGFRMVDENKMREMNGDQLRKINQNGILALIMAHMFSLGSIRDLFARQAEQGKVPEQLAAMTAPTV